MPHISFSLEEPKELINPSIISMLAIDAMIII